MMAARVVWPGDSAAGQRKKDTRGSIGQTRAAPWDSGPTVKEELCSNTALDATSRSSRAMSREPFDQACWHSLGSTSATSLAHSRSTGDGWYWGRTRSGAPSHRAQRSKGEGCQSRARSRQKPLRSRPPRSGRRRRCRACRASRTWARRTSRSRRRSRSWSSRPSWSYRPARPWTPCPTPRPSPFPSSSTSSRPRPRRSPPRGSSRRRRADRTCWRPSWT
mmetsp:Transcript_24765/g.81644  ORF Transcript_24765/g.81644 Transcript_24765/m.81644 type:complete len:220 (+) Transcript_24765:695-1354(+)